MFKLYPTALRMERESHTLPNTYISLNIIPEALNSEEKSCVNEQVLPMILICSEKRGNGYAGADHVQEVVDSVPIEQLQRQWHHECR